MKKVIGTNLFLIVLLLGVSSCPEKKVPPTTPPEPGAFTQLNYEYSKAKRGVYPGNAPLTGPGFFFFRMLA